MATPPTDDPLANSDRTVGVHAVLIQDTKSFKRGALLFDQIGIPALGRPAYFPVDFGAWDEVFWLRDIGIVWDIGHHIFNIGEEPTVRRQYLEAIAAVTGMPIDVKAIPDERLEREAGRRRGKMYRTGAAELIAILTRMYSINLRNNGINAFPILTTFRQIGNVFPSGR